MLDDTVEQGGELAGISKCAGRNCIEDSGKLGV